MNMQVPTPASFHSEQNNVCMRVLSQDQGRIRREFMGEIMEGDLHAFAMEVHPFEAYSSCIKTCMVMAVREENVMDRN